MIGNSYKVINTQDDYKTVYMEIVNQAGEILAEKTESDLCLECQEIVCECLPPCEGGVHDVIWEDNGTAFCLNCDWIN